MKILLLLPLLLGFSVPAIAHNEFNGGAAGSSFGGGKVSEEPMTEEEGEGADCGPGGFSIGC